MFCLSQISSHYSSVSDHSIAYSSIYHVMSSTVRLLPLHENEQFQDNVIELLNDEWPQSKTIRMRRLERSCTAFPLI